MADHAWKDDGKGHYACSCGLWSVLERDLSTDPERASNFGYRQWLYHVKVAEGRSPSGVADYIRLGAVLDPELKGEALTQDEYLSGNGKWSVKDTLTGAVYRQPNRMIADAVARMHGQSEVVPGWPEDRLVARLRAIVAEADVTDSINASEIRAVLEEEDRK